MRYCPDNIGRYTIREMLTYMNRTLLNFNYVSRHCITSKKVLSVDVRLGKRTYHDSCNSSAHRRVRGIVFWNYMHPGYIEYDKLLLFSELYHLYIKERGNCFNFTKTLNFQTLPLPDIVEIRAYITFVTFHQFINWKVYFMC